MVTAETLDSLLTAVRDNPCDASLRRVLSDALEEMGGDGEGQRHIASIIDRVSFRSTAPDSAMVKRIKKAFAYRKRTVVVTLAKSLQLQGTWWDGGSRDVYTVYNLTTGAKKSTPVHVPFSGTPTAPVWEIERGTVVVQTGTFCGKPATMCIWIHPDDYDFLES